MERNIIIQVYDTGKYVTTEELKGKEEVEDKVEEKEECSLLDKIEPRLREALSLLGDREKDYFTIRLLSASNIENVRPLILSNENMNIENGQPAVGIQPSLGIIVSFKSDGIQKEFSVHIGVGDMQYLPGDIRWIASCISKWYTRMVGKK